MEKEAVEQYKAFNISEDDPRYQKLFDAIATQPEPVRPLNNVLESNVVQASPRLQFLVLERLAAFPEERLNVAGMYMDDEERLSKVKDLDSMMYTKVWKIRWGIVEDKDALLTMLKESKVKTHKSRLILAAHLLKFEEDHAQDTNDAITEFAALAHDSSCPNDIRLKANTSVSKRKPELSLPEEVIQQLEQTKKNAGT